MLANHSRRSQSFPGSLCAVKVMKKRLMNSDDVEDLRNELEALRFIRTQHCGTDFDEIPVGAQFLQRMEVEAQNSDYVFMVLVSGSSGSQRMI